MNSYLPPNPILPQVLEPQPYTRLGIDQLRALGRQQAWGLRVVGKAPYPLEPVQLGQWLLVPFDQEPEPVPSWALARMTTIEQAGIHPLGYVVVHELPTTSGAKIPSAPADWRLSQPSARIPTSLSKVAGATAGVVAGILLLAGVAVAALAVLALAAFLAVPALFASALFLDPLLCAVMADGTWIQIAAW